MMMPLDYGTSPEARARQLQIWEQLTRKRAGEYRAAIIQLWQAHGALAESGMVQSDIRAIIGRLMVEEAMEIQKGDDLRNQLAALALRAGDVSARECE